MQGQVLDTSVAKGTSMPSACKGGERLIFCPVASSSYKFSALNYIKKQAPATVRLKGIIWCHSSYYLHRFQFSCHNGGFSLTPDADIEISREKKKAF